MPNHLFFMSAAAAMQQAKVLLGQMGPLITTESPVPVHAIPVSAQAMKVPVEGNSTTTSNGQT